SGNVDIWPIEAMQGLFRLLGGGGEVGVTLTASSLMIPNKSIAGLMFASQESDWESCAYCERKNCPSRRAPFKEKL
ncbi:MAG: vitamin B12 dependent-methionine synthase activation domain-containing protein, partial [Sphaerochaetaceae bacterium]